MRTTLTIDNDVLDAARDLAAAQNRSLGEVVSDLARRGLRREQHQQATRNGIPLLPSTPHAPMVTSETVNALRDDAL